MTTAPPIGWYTYAEAAELLRMSVRTLKRRIAAGQIRVIRPSGGAPRITSRELAAYKSAAERMVA